MHNHLTPFEETELNPVEIPAEAVERTLRIVLVGPTNVGKSTLFNRLTHSRRAIVCDRPGVTVDRNEMFVKDSDIGPMNLIDTGGVGPEALRHPLGAEIERAAKAALDSADLVLFVVDGTQELGTEELEVASWLRRHAKIANNKIWVLANKSDTKRHSIDSFHNLGFEKVLPVSAENDIGIIDLWEEMRVALRGEQFQIFQDKNPTPRERTPRVLVLGRPNVGKSTLLNAIIGQDRHVVSQVPGTTRDPIESTIERHGVNWSFLDTAGMRRPGRLERDVEWVAREKLKEEARRADVAILLLDAAEGVTDLDANIGGMAIDFGLSVIIVMNKWDKMGGTEADALKFKLDRSKDLKLEFLKWCPVIQASALTGMGVTKVLKKIEEVMQEREKRVSTGHLNRIFEARFKSHPHPVVRGKSPKFYYMSQIGDRPPEFVIFSNITGPELHFSFKRFIINSLRDQFGFEGTPIKIHLKQAKDESRKPF